MLTRPFLAQDEQPILDLTISTFEPFYEGSFRSLMGEVIFGVQHADWREEYAWSIPALHDPNASKYLDVAVVGGVLAGYVSWEVDAPRGHGTITILAVSPGHRRSHVGRQLCEQAMTAMKNLGPKLLRSERVVTRSTPLPELSTRASAAARYLWLCTSRNSESRSLKTSCGGAGVRSGLIQGSAPGNPIVRVCEFNR